MKMQNVLLGAAVLGLGFVLMNRGDSAEDEGYFGSKTKRLKLKQISFVNPGEVYLLEIPNVPDQVAMAAMESEDGYLPDDALALNTELDLVTEDGAIVTEDGTLLLPISLPTGGQEGKPVSIFWMRGAPFELGSFVIGSNAQAAMGRRRLTGRRVGHHHESVRVPGVV